MRGFVRLALRMVGLGSDNLDRTRVACARRGVSFLELVGPSRSAHGTCRAVPGTDWHVPCKSQAMPNATRASIAPPE
jgi:hypothetical protein